MYVWERHMDKITIISRVHAEFSERTTARVGISELMRRSLAE